MSASCGNVFVQYETMSSCVLSSVTMVIFVMFACNKAQSEWNIMGRFAMHSNAFAVLLVSGFMREPVPPDRRMHWVDSIAAVGAVLCDMLHRRGRPCAGGGEG